MQLFPLILFGIATAFSPGPNNIMTSYTAFNFVLADAYYQVHIYANYLLLALVSLHILAVIVHHFVFKDKILNKIT